MPRTHVLALDEGTTGTNACLFDDQGRLVGKSGEEITQHFPHPGWVEHDAEEIWRRTLRVARAAVKTARRKTSDVAAIGITNQRETLVAWDSRTGNALTKAIVWQDRRTADLCQRLKPEDAWVSRKTGLRLDPYFSGTKLRWLVEHDKGVARARTAGRLRWGTIDAWLVHRLTGGRVHATDASNASRTLLFDLRKGDWDEELLKLFRARREELPEVVDSSGAIGDTDASLLGVSVPITGIAGDQQAALFGQACFKPGLAKNTYGTGCFALTPTGTSIPRPKGGLLGTVAWRLQGRVHYALEGSVFIGGAVIQWLRDGLEIVDDAAQTEALARSVPDTGDVYLVPAFVGLGAPHWDPYARGVLVGLTRGTTRAHIVRAGLESISFQSADVVTLLGQQAGAPVRRLRVDGGAAANDFLLQHQADVLGIPVERGRLLETTALGAAYLAGLGVGVWENLDAVAHLWRRGASFEPRASASWRKDQRQRWREAVGRSRAWARPDVTRAPSSGRARRSRRT